MKRLVAYVLFVLAFWMSALTLLGLVVVLDGDCFTNKICNQNQHELSLILLSVAAVVFVIALRWFSKKLQSREN